MATQRQNETAGTRPAAVAARCDVVIAGAGFAGLALAIALRQALGDGVTVVVADPTLGGPSRDGRASAIAAAARRLFDAIGAWQPVAGRAQPILDMVVTDSKLQDAVRPVLLTFAGEVEPGEPFAYMIENRDLIDALVDKAREAGVTLRESAVVASDTTSAQVAVRFADGGSVAARLLVGADGARSGVRERAGIPFRGWHYGQSGIVTTVAHERDHDGRAE